MVQTRGSTPGERAAAVPEGERGSHNFKLIWTEYKKLGWTSKAPSRGIETRWKYILPGGNANGTVGIDYVLGEQAVVDYAVQHAQKETIARVQATVAHDAAKASALQSPSHDKQSVSSPTSAATQSPPNSPANDPTVNLSACTESPVAHPPPRPPLNISAVLNPVGVAGTGLIPTTSPALTPPSSVPVLASVSATTATMVVTSTQKKRRRILLVDEDDSDDEADTTGHDFSPVIDLSGNDADGLNSSSSDDRDYLVLDSGDESEETDLNDLDVSVSEASVEDTIDEDGEDLFTNEERHFADHFLASLGGEEKVLAGEVIGPALKDLATTGWEPNESPDVDELLATPDNPVGNDAEYPDLATVQHGPTEATLNLGGSPIALFFRFMPVAMWQHVAECGNFYMHEQLDKRVDVYFDKKEKRERKAKAAGKNKKDEDSSGCSPRVFLRETNYSS